MADDEIDDRLSRRFGDSQNEEQVESEEKSKTSNTAMSSSPSDTDRNEQTSQNAQNIKKEWNVRSFYLSDDLEKRLTTTFKRLDLDISESESEIDLKKTRHFYPLVVELGLDALESMDVTEVTEILED